MILDKYKKIKVLREHIVLLPGLKSYKDFDIAVEIGHHEVHGKPLTHKELLSLNIASPATVRRHLSHLIRDGLVLKHQHKNDQRVTYFTLSVTAHVLFDQCIKELSALLDTISDSSQV